MDYISESDLLAIRNAIGDAEKKTSAEVRVIIEEKCKSDVLDRAAFAFKKLKMHETALRNGVLIYVSVTDRQCAIIGDSGINHHVENDFWKTVLDEMVVFFSAEKLKEGIIHAVQRAASKLALHFPFNTNDGNELPDEVVTRL